MTRDQFLRREAIKQRAADGAIHRIIAAEFGVSRVRIGQIVGGTRKVSLWDAESINFARARWDAGLTAAEIAREMGVTRNSIIGVAHRNGFTVRRSPLKRAAA